MIELTDVTPRPDRAIVNDCWNRIGVRGDRSCPELKQYVHCRNCPVYSAGAATGTSECALDIPKVARTRAEQNGA